MKRMNYTIVGMVFVMLLLGASAATATDTVTRTLPVTASPNDIIMVSLAIDFDDQAAVNRLVITETVPEGWVIVDASNNGNLATTGKITWMMIEAIGGVIPEDGAVFTYNVTVPSDVSGLYSFSGVYGTNVAGSDIVILGDVNITIGGTYDPPTLVTYTITNRTIEPPQTTSIDVAFSEYVSAIIEIEDAGGNLVDQLYSSSSVKNPDPKAWDGTYTNGTTVPDGTYTVNVTGVNTTTGLSVINTSETITVSSGVGTADTTPPNTAGHDPAQDATGVPIDTSVTVHVLDAGTGVNNSTIVMTVNGTTVTPDITGTAADYTLVYAPPEDFGYEQLVNVTIAAADLNETPNVMETDEYSFTTESGADTTHPTVTDNTPTGTDVVVSAAITVTFNEAMNETSAEDAFSIDPSVTGSVSWDGNMMAFTPDSNLVYDTTYNITIGTGAEDLAGNPLEGEFVWNFTTGSAPADNGGSSGGSGSGTYPPGWGEPAPTSAATPAPTAAPEPTVAQDEAPAVAPTEAPTKAPTVAPTETVTTKMKTEGTPGFGAVVTVFAIAGLLVAAYLVMRRRE